MKYPKEDVARAHEYLSSYVALGFKRVYANVTHVSKSGMSRRIKFYLIADNSLLNVTRHVARLIGAPQNDAGLRMDGCGMNMAFAAIDHCMSALGVEDWHKKYHVSHI
jgi:hypothetical protein